MIERMKTVCIVTTSDAKKKMISDVRDLGVLHVSQLQSADAKTSEKFAALNRTRMMLSERKVQGSQKPVLSDDDFNRLDGDVQKMSEILKSASDRRSKAVMERDAIGQWGDFDPDEIRSLCENDGIELHFYKMGKKEYANLCKAQDISVIRLASVEKQIAAAVVGKPLDRSYGATEFSLPARGASELDSEIAQCDAQIAQANKVLDEAALNITSYDDQILKCKNLVRASEVSQTSVTEDGLVWLCGYIPSDDIPAFTKKADECCWAYSIDDPSDEDEHVPTKVRYSKVSGLMKPVFDILGTVPGYHEYDISFWFLLFFSLFFAMIIGDAGYGAIFLAVAAALHIKQKKVNDVIMLLYVVSITTIGWGAVTGTWFGLESAMHVPLLRKLVIPAIANYPEYFGMTGVGQQNNVMQFCFMIGTLQLTLACAISIVSKVKTRNLSLIADIGWLLSINSLYYVVLLLVINADVNIAPCAVLVGVGFLLVCLFGGMSPDKSFSQGLKAGLADSFTNFLNTISAFGNIMSYIRLFAVGLASLAIAQSFNDMAGGFTGWLRIVAAAIFVIGHALNLVMGLLSVIVHGVRLNLLEFSGQLGMEWSGTAYEPFKVSTK